MIQVKQLINDNKIKIHNNIILLADYPLEHLDYNIILILHIY